jgi:glycerophosphoryl diester phosphodiesterase
MLRTDDADAEGVSRLHAAGLQVFSSTANSKADWQKYIDLGMDGILTDDPEGLLAFLGRARRTR